MNDDPVRLRDDPASPAALRTDLRAAAAWSAPFDVTRAAAQFDAALASASGTHGRWMRNARWWGLAAIGLASLVGALTYAAWRPTVRTAEVPPVRTFAATASQTGGSAAPGIDGRRGVGVTESNTTQTLLVGSQPATAMSEPTVRGASSDVASAQAPAAADFAAANATAGDPSLAPAHARDLPLAGALSPPRLAPRADGALADRGSTALPGSPLRAGHNVRIATTLATTAATPSSVADVFGDRDREREQLTYAYAELSRDPARALALADAGQRAFPTSAHVEEREALAIEALVHLHRWPEARARAQRFVARYPRGPYTGMIRQIAGQSALQSRTRF